MIHIHRYVLRSKSPLNARTTAQEFEGALVKIDAGYGCLHPWPSLGDLPLDAQLDALRSGHDTDLTTQTRLCCAIDGQARREGRWLFDNTVIPPSHAIAGSLPEDQMADFRHIKVKSADQLPSLIEKFPNAKFRLDFNETLTQSEFLQFLKTAPMEKIHFIEDPTPYDPEIWRQSTIPLAIDRETKTGSGYQYRVLKPARQSTTLEPGVTHIITSYMDHPLGQLYAAWQATQFKGTLDTCGLLTHPLFEPSDFTTQLQIKDQTLIPPKGTGLGFDNQLESLLWSLL
jgi:O-succinylbenzoate synthase